MCVCILLFTRQTTEFSCKIDNCFFNSQSAAKVISGRVKINKVLLHCIVLYCIVLYCIVLYCIVLRCIVLISALNAHLPRTAGPF